VFSQSRPLIDIPTWPIAISAWEEFGVLKGIYTQDFGIPSFCKGSLSFLVCPAQWQVYPDWGFYLKAFASQITKLIPRLALTTLVGILHILIDLKDFVANIHSIWNTYFPC